MLKIGRNIANAAHKQQKQLSTWSPLGTAFNAPPTKRINITRNDVVSASN